MKIRITATCFVDLGNNPSPRLIEELRENNGEQAFVMLTDAAADDHKTTNFTITADFDKAVQQPWTPDKCVLAQTLIRHNIRPGRLGSVSVWGDQDNYHAAHHIRRTFDTFFYEPGDETKPALVELRDSLPDTDEEVQS